MRVLAFSAFAWPLRLMLLLGPVTILLATIFAMEPSWIRVVAVTAAAGLVVAITFFSGVRVGAGNEAVSLALVPFWRFRLPYRRIASVAVETVRPFEDFGGWGIKGSHKKRGILLSAGGTVPWSFDSPTAAPTSRRSAAVRRAAQRMSRAG